VEALHYFGSYRRQSDCLSCGQARECAHSEVVVIPSQQNTVEIHRVDFRSILGIAIRWALSDAARIGPPRAAYAIALSPLA
jgi:hypothetical protein